MQDIVFLVGSSRHPTPPPPPAFWIYYPSLCWSARFLLRNPTIILWKLFFFFFILMLSRFCDSWQLEYTVIQCRCLWFILMGVLRTSWICMSISFLKLVSFGALFLQIDFMSIYLSSTPRTPIMCTLVHLRVSHKSLRISSLFFVFLFAPLTRFQMICIKINGFFLLIDTACYWSLLVIFFQFRYCILQLKNSFFFFCRFYIFVGIFILFIHHFPDFF